MDTVLDHRGYGIKHDNLGVRANNKHIKALTFIPQVEGDYNTNVQAVKMYQLGKNRLWFPKFYGIRNFGPPQKENERKGDDIELEFRGQLKDEQIGAAEDSLRILKETGGGVLCLPTGFGKTVIAIYLCCQLKKKVLWITNQTNLLEQTKKSFENFTGCEVGIIKRDRVDTSQPVVIGMLQSISMKQYPKEIFDHFGVVIYDECHKTPSFVFSRSLFKVATQYMIGLSATPKRKDGLDAVITESLGPIIVEVKIQLKIPLVRKIKAKYDKVMIEYKNRADKANIPAMINDVCISNTRNQIIVDAIIEAFNENRHILVLTERRQHANDLGELLASKDLGEQYGLYLGQMKSSELAESNTKRIIIGTYSMCGTGYDNKYLNTVMLTTSKRDIIQIIGRILGFRSTGSLQPLIIDIQDTYGVFRGQSYARNSYYKKQNFDLEDDKIDDIRVTTKTRPYKDKFTKLYERQGKEAARFTRSQK